MSDWNNNKNLYFLKVNSDENKQKCKQTPDNRWESHGVVSVFRFFASYLKILSFLFLLHGLYYWIGDFRIRLTFERLHVLAIQGVDTCLLSGRHDETQLCKSWLSKAKRPLSYYAVILCYIIPTWNVRTVPVKWLNHPQMSAYLDVPSFYFEGAGWDNYFMRREGSYCNVHLLFPRNWADMIPAFTWIAACIFPLAWTNRGFFFFLFWKRPIVKLARRRWRV